YLGVDRDADSVEVARWRAGGLPCRFDVAEVPPLPPGRFDVVLLLETMLAFPDKTELLESIGRVLDPGGRFAFTLEEGSPLTASERGRMPNPDTVWPVTLDAMRSLLKGAGLDVTWQDDWSASHGATAAALADGYAADAEAIGAEIGPSRLRDLV